MQGAALDQASAAVGHDAAGETVCEARGIHAVVWPDCLLIAVGEHLEGPRLSPRGARYPLYGGCAFRKFCGVFSGNSAVSRNVVIVES